MINEREAEGKNGLHITCKGIKGCFLVIKMGSGSVSDGEEDAVHDSGSGSESNLDAETDSKSQRGPTVKAKANKKIVISYNKRGVPTGSGARKLATFEGLVARSMVLITYDSWLNVDAETKEACWQYVKTHFKLHSKSRKHVLQSIGIKWKNFKHYLYKKFIKPLKDDKSKEAKKQLYTPPAQYPSVKRKDWRLFVSQRTKTSFEEISQKNSALRKRNKYNHRLSRKGYVGLISEIMEETGKEEDEIDRVECWKKARQMKKGGFDPAVQKVLDKIEMLKKERDYSEDPMGSLDLLTEALGTDEQRGRVRGMGRYVTPQQYFLIPRNVKQYLKLHDKMWHKRLKAVEDELERRKCASINASEGASNCQVWSDEDEEPNVPREPNDKSCYLAVDDPSNIVAKGTIVNPTAPDGNVEVMVETSVQAEAMLPIPIPEEFVETVKDAIGYILSWPSDLVIPCSGLKKIVAKKKEKKAADQAKEKRRKEEKEPRKEEQRKEEEAGKGKEEERTEEEEKRELGSGTHQKKEKKKRQRDADNEEVPMPKKVAVEDPKSPETLASVAKVTKKGSPLKKMMTRGQRRGRKRIEERMGLRMTAMMVDGQVAKVDCIKVQCEDDLFGHPSYTYLNWNDFDSLFAMDELSGAVVASYIMYLYEQIKNGSQRDHGVCFMTPTAIMNYERKARAKNIEDASRVIAERLSTRKQKDLVLLPYNPGRHWVLGVINMKTSTGYYLDSLSISDVNHQFKKIVDAAIALYDVQAGTNKRTKLNWVNSKCPRQPGSTECGYFMLKFMKEVVKHGVRVLENDIIGGDSNEYTEADIDDIREEWAIYVSNFIFR